ncbi:histamine H2 receptor-like [Uloborus diversus]|uniref:histamine H2 receptor-like n=1 Tax=Uloborus diversus TaxID=327109 RepID=UPI0024095ABE|nr:histamine H2 receptor-like [Uloborus diversus]
MEKDLSTTLQAGSLGVLGAIGSCSNAFILLLFYKKRSVRTFSNRFVLSLAVTHFLQCFLLTPPVIAAIKGYTFNAALYKITSSLTMALNLASSLSVLLIAIDRNCAVNNPLHYTVTITKKRTGFLISMVWVASFLLSLPLLTGVPEVAHDPTGDIHDWNAWKVMHVVYIFLVSAIGFLIPFGCVSCLYFIMVRAAKTNNAKNRRSSSNSSSSSEVVVNFKPQRKTGTNEYSLRRNYSAERGEASQGNCCFASKHKATITGLLVVCSFVLCWSPYYISLILKQFVQFPSLAKYLTSVTTFLACVLDPYVYFYRNKNSFKQAKKMILRLFCRNQELVVKRIAHRQQRAVSPDGVFRLPSSFSRTELSAPLPLISNSTFELLPRSAVTAMSSSSWDKNLDKYCADPAKLLIHQDSSSSNDSSDACTSTARLGSVLSIDDATSVYYLQFHQRSIEDATIEIPLDQEDED